MLVEYTVVEAVCEECGVVNDHFTALCPFHVTPPVEPTPLHVALPLRNQLATLVATPDPHAVWYPQR